ncbi:MAG: 2-phosphosulfolactate phosphatase, partial [Erysipelotrichia bacterium]|nr:2-phosphosulfolactate phosphatase [Erysipelotrichia bacterium]
MDVQILSLLDGAEKAEGITVIIDVFRAFSLEAYLFAQGAERILPVGNLETAYQLKNDHPDYVLIGERKGAKCEGFDYGNSPSSVKGIDFTGKTVVHTTSAGTQGISHAIHSSAILGGSLVTARATAACIRQQNPQQVSLVCMGWEGHRNTEEDLLCAEYLKALLEDRQLKDLKQRERDLMYTEGKKFFDPSQAEVFPEEDFWMCIRHD